MNELGKQAQGLQKYADMGIKMVMEYAPKVILAIIILIVGLWLIKKLKRFIGKMMDKNNVDPSLAPFLKSLIGALLKVLLIVSVISMLGVEVTSFVAILGAAGLAVGLALQGTLQNFAGGVIILLLKPFRVGDFIEVKGYMGTVDMIQIFSTYIKTLDNKTIIIPNGEVANTSLTNFSTEPKRRVDWTFGIGYGDSIEKGKETLMGLIKEDSRILSDPAEPFVAVSELGDSSVNFAVRAWVKAEDYWDVFFQMNEKVYNKFNEVGLNIPYPQMDVHVHNK